jgi:hypothetical protein
MPTIAFKADSAVAKRNIFAVDRRGPRGTSLEPAMTATPDLEQGISIMALSSMIPAT